MKKKNIDMAPLKVFSSGNTGENPGLPSNRERVRNPQNATGQSAGKVWGVG